MAHDRVEGEKFTLAHPHIRGKLVGMLNKSISGIAECGCIVKFNVPVFSMLGVLNSSQIPGPFSAISTAIPV